jgi:hypothetical protein
MERSYESPEGPCLKTMGPSTYASRLALASPSAL